MASRVLFVVVALAGSVVGSMAPAPDGSPWSTLMAAVDGPAGHVVSVGQAVGLPPTVQDGIGPGSALQMGVDGIQFVCTSSFLLRAPATGAYYLSTAGHCLVRDADDPTPVTGAQHPAMVKNRFDICVDGCLNNGLGLGTYVSLVPQGPYHPVAFAVSGGVGNDFGILEIPAELHGRLRPHMPQWGGPTGTAEGSGGIGDVVVHYGHGALLVPGVAAVVTRTPADQGRVAAFGFSDDEAFEALGHVTGGDSGSGAALGALDPTGIARGTQALGVITHGIAVIGAPLMSGTVIEHGIDLVRRHTGLDLELVAAGDPLPQGPTLAPASGDVEVQAPRAGARIDVASKRVRIEGTAANAGAAPKAGDQVQVAIDDPDYAVASRVPVSGNATWAAVWDLAGAAPGGHVIRARLVDADGVVLDQQNVTVDLHKGPSATGSPATASASSTGSQTRAPAPGKASTSPAAGAPAGQDAAAQAPAGAPGLGAMALAAAVVGAAALRRR